MRSRYSAYALGLTDYLFDTWRPVHRPSEIAPTPPDLKWLSLEVRRHRVVDPEHAEVEFIARSKLAGRARRMHEVSRFVCEAGRWFYCGGDIR